MYEKYIKIYSMCTQVLFSIFRIHNKQIQDATGTTFILIQ